ncbi:MULTISPECIES: rhamnulokinase family protein [unclassified Brachybacterium]|uniref:rhamnulokinase n=1 Tax=unclassified Brachybacterium TaxID=2623841 RepID=UPI003618934C
MVHEEVQGSAQAAAVPPVAIAAVDLGATSARVMLGVVSAAGIELTEARRFAHELRDQDGHLTWDIDELWAQIQGGLREAAALARERGLELASIGIDSWAVDYVLVGPDGSRIGNAISYRDSRTDGVADEVAERVSRERQFEITGIAQQPFNTIYQFAADERLRDLPEGSHALMLPDYFAFLLTGQRRTEVTNASTTGLFDVRGRTFSPELLAAVGVDLAIFAPLIEPGERIGEVREEIAAELGLDGVAVTAVGSHDTASAVLAVPSATSVESTTDGPIAYISSGTWSLVGLELREPIPTEAARRAGFTNEGGVGGTTRFLQNVMGLWLVSECMRQWSEEGRQTELEELLEAAAAEPGGRFVIDATDSQFLPPGAMADRVARAARPGPAAHGEHDVPRTSAEIVRCLLDSLAIAYRDAVTTACELAGTGTPARVHVVGGGSQGALLNQLTADALGVEVVAGPVEATALGNIAVQAAALGAIEDSAEAMRARIRAGAELSRFAPS